MEFISDNLEHIEKQIQSAINISNRQLDDVLLLAVTKTQSVESMQKVADVLDYKNQDNVSFGENKVQEFIGKYDEFDEKIKWHFIGHLQRNKVKQIIGKVDLIHSVDSLRLATEINKHSLQQNCVTNILIEVNVAQEESKDGILEEDLVQLLEGISKMEAIKVKGLMTVAPFVDNPEENRKIFSKLKQLLVDINGKKIHNITMTELSMGMTNDFQIAIEEGSTIVRIGTAIFGKRIYN